MHELIVEFEKALAEHESKIGKKDSLVGLGTILADELKKKTAAVVTLGELLADFYAKERASSTTNAFNLSSIYRSTP